LFILKFILAWNIFIQRSEAWLLNEKFKNEILSKIVLGRVGITKDVASAVLFLSSQALSLITGTTLMIGGGWTAQ
jgi:NAD(P)-dependent dehydrogenase (short-subunit alcohol dehydrogenase family)